MLLTLSFSAKGKAVRVYWAGVCPYCRQEIVEPGQLEVEYLTIPDVVAIGKIAECPKCRTLVPLRAFPTREEATRFVEEVKSEWR